MAEQTEDIVGLVESVVRPLIEFPDELQIEARPRTAPSSWSSA